MATRRARNTRMTPLAPLSAHSLLTRRTFLKSGLAAGIGAVTLNKGLSASQGRVIDMATVADRAGSFRPADVKHIVVLMQENRSFDHYFGTLAGVHGFKDPFAGRYPGQKNSRPFLQAGPLAAVPGWTGPTTKESGEVLALLAPWQLQTDPPTENGQTTNDIDHGWDTQHDAWNGGAMDQWFAAHAAVDTNNSPTGEGTNDGYMTMGYLAPPDLAFYHALADAFTICDGYHCSVLGPTDPNRLMLMSNSVGIGQTNGPLLDTLVQTRPQPFGSFNFTTMPEALQDAGVTWKVYGDPSSQLLFSVLPYFEQYVNGDNPDLSTNAFAYQYPAGFASDVAAGTLPQVSWLLPPVASCEHPAAAPSMGEMFVSQVLQTLVSNPEVWEQTVLFVIYDENGGWFDHVPPPTPTLSQIASDPTNAGEWWSGGTAPLTGTEYFSANPVGLGFRTPCLIVSPFSRGGYLCSPYYKGPGGTVKVDPAGTFDATSVNRFIAKVFDFEAQGVDIPNLSAWRQSVTGDFTTAFAGVNNPSVPSLPVVTVPNDVEAVESSVVNALLGTEDYAPQPYPSPTNNANSGHGFPPPQDGTHLSRTYRTRGS